MDHVMKNIGLTGKEIKIYLACVQFGPMSVTEVARKSELKRTTVHEILRKLLQRRYIYSRYIGKRRYYVAASPEKLLEHLAAKREKIDQQIEDFRAKLPELESLYNATNLKPTIRFYEGSKGVREVMEELLDCDQKAHLHILSTNIVKDALGSEYLKRWITRRIKRKITVRGVRTLQGQLGEPFFDGSRDDYLREVRIAPTGFSFPMAMTIVDNKVVLLSSTKERYGLILESLEFSQGMRGMFEILWSVSEKDI